MVATQEHLITCGTGNLPARLAVDRTRTVPPPPPPAAHLTDRAAALRRLMVRSYNTRVHVEGAPGDGRAAAR